MINRLGDDLHPKLVANLRHDAQPILAQALKRVGRSARLICPAAKKLRSRPMHPFGHGERLLAAFDGAGPGDDRQPRPANRGVRPGKADHRVVVFDVAAHQLVRLRNLDDFLHARHLFQRALFDFALVAGNPDGSTRRARHGMRPVPQLLDFLANRAHLLFRSVRLHNDEHDFPLNVFAHGQPPRLP